MVNMSKLLQGNIIKMKSVNSWQEALQIASDPLLKKGVITNQYVEAMVQSVKQYGPYMVIGDGFALMHSRPGEAVNEIGMSLLILEESVDLEGKEVKIFLILAATDNSSHLDALREVMINFMDDEKFEIIKYGHLDKVKKLF